MNPDALIVLKAGLPPILGCKLRFFRHPVLKRRLLPPPDIAPLPSPSPHPPLPSPPSPAQAGGDDWSFETLVRSLGKEGAPLPPPKGSGEALVATWIDALIDHAAIPHDRSDGTG